MPGRNNRRRPLRVYALGALAAAWILWVSYAAACSLATKNTLMHFMDVADDGTNHDYSNIKVDIFDGIPAVGPVLGWAVGYWLYLAFAALVVYVVILHRRNRQQNQTTGHTSSSTSHTP